MNVTDPFYAWLLASSIPSIRYLTYVNLLDYAGDDERVVAARRAIMQEGPVPAILAAQTPTGAWADEHSYYTPKYVSTHWSMLLLTELAIDGTDERFQRGVDFMLTATANDIEKNLANDKLWLSCFWGNLLRYARHAGRWADPRVDPLVRYVTLDLQRGPCRCPINDGYSCGWGVVRSLWSVAALPPSARTEAIDGAIEQGVTFLLDAFRLVDANYPTPDQGRIHPLWFKLNFPLFYQVDILFTLRVLAAVDALGHPQAEAALDWLVQQRQANGHWRGRSPYRQRTWREMGDREETNRWVSLQSATVLKQAGRWSG